MASHIKYIIGIALLLPSLALLSQESDAQLWTGLGASAKLSKAWQIEMGIGQRSIENMDLLRQQYVQMGAAYSWHKGWRVGTKYRYAAYKYPEHKLGHRWVLDVSYKHRWGRWQGQWRERWQHRWKAQSYNAFLRSRWKIAYNIKHCKINPFAAAEHFLALQGKAAGLTQEWRWQLGASFPLVKAWELSASYMLSQEYNIAQPVRAHVFLLAIKGNFKLYHKKSRD